MEPATPDPAPAAGPAGVPAEWTWCLELPQPFDALQGIALGMVDGRRRPGEAEETGGPLLNVYLVVCALAQVLGDHLRRPLRRRSLPGRLRRALTAPFRLGLRRRERALRDLARDLAAALMAGDAVPGQAEVRALRRLAGRRWPASVRAGRLRVPECFRGGDLYPADCALLARRASAAAGAGADHAPVPPVVVVGLGLSGLYLAPLCAAALDRLGHRRAGTAGLWPGLRPSRAERRRLRALAGAGGWALVVGAPSVDAAAVTRAVATLAQLGLPESRVCLTARDAPGPAAGRSAGSAVQQTITWGGYRRPDEVTLEPDGDHVSRLLSRESIERRLNRPEALGRLGAEAAAVVGQADAGAPAGGGAHGRCRPARRLFEVELRTAAGRRSVVVMARSVGLGFFGYHAWLVAACLGDHVPEVLGIQDGILVLGIQDGILLSHLEAGRGAPDPLEPGDLEAVASYVADRGRRLSLRQRTGSTAARSPDAGLRPLAARLGSGFPRWSRRAQAGVGALLGRALRAGRPSVVDGRMGTDEWLRRPAAGLLKLEFEARSLGVCDPVHDLAAAAVQLRLEPEETRLLVESYERLTGDVEAVPARLAAHALAIGLAELAAVGSLAGDLAARAARERLARELALRETVLTRAVSGYLATVLLAGGEPPRDLAGVLEEPAEDWALGLDGVLETDRLGFECLSPAGVAAVRALRAHGRRVWCCTEQSLGELRERCRALGLTGGTAEGGSVAWDERRGQAEILVGAAGRRSLRLLRAALLDETDVLVDPRYVASLRLFRHTDAGRRAVDGEEVRAVAARHGVGGLDVVPGRRWTTVLVAGASPATALDRLRAGASPAPPLHVVAGGTADMDLLPAAAGRHAPASVEPAFRARAEGLGVRIASRPYQAGLLQAVDAAVHRSGGSCERCRRLGPRRLEAADAALLTALGLQDRGRVGRAAFLLRPTAGAGR